MDPPDSSARRSDHNPALETYTHGYGKQVLEVMSRRTVDRELGFLVPYLRLGMRILDCGCGPGTITTGVAEFVAPGEVVGIDIEPSQIEAARRRAVGCGLPSAHFEVANVYELPFPDASIDAAYAHTVIQHVREPLRALREIRRVLAPGGLLGLRDDD